MRFTSLLAVLLVLPCLAQAQALEIRWRAPEGCPSEQDVTRDVLALLPPGAVSDPSRVTLEVDVSQYADGFEARLAVRSAAPAPPRLLQGPSCQSVARPQS